MSRTPGYPTVAVGIKLGPKNANLANYTFRVPKAVSDTWTQCMVDQKIRDMNTRQNIAVALKQCKPARADILYSMAYQMGVDGLAAFKNTLVTISNGNFSGASAGMLNCTLKCRFLYGFVKLGMRLSSIL